MRKKQDEQLNMMEAIRMLSKEKSIDENVLIEAIEEALATAYRNKRGRDSQPLSNLSVMLNRDTGRVEVFARMQVVEEVEDEQTQITLSQAREANPGFEIGDIAEVEVTPQDFGRVAAQTAKQVLMQRIRDAERGKVYDEYIEKENEILTAIVQRVDSRCVYMDLGHTEGLMEQSQFMPGEEYHPNDHIKVYVLNVKRSVKGGPQIMVSRVHPGLVKRLFELEVPEIQTGRVQIKSIAREAGSRTKMAVYAPSDMMIDPVGACVGPRGTRVDSVVNELSGEKIDIIKWSPEPGEFIANALNPAHVMSVFIADEEKVCRVVVPDNQLSLAIGKEGQNARLAARLTGWKIDIKSASQAEEMAGMISAEGVDELPDDMPPADDYMPDDMPPDGFGY
ncbi:MAG: transcription termination factor NusA [Eubacteriales bacterium]|nr:transcription termination factor NusA [Eubacteriales bacterium]MDD3882299.1 transcription termination factor NusA [Eubacteriales bacterium]MDD4512045.1 transcription termination factor NusA [Eubacteriales bacterium]